MSILSSSTTTNYILIDFSCSKHFSHNWTYLLGFGKFIEQGSQAASVEYWINRAADRRKGFSAGSQVQSFLLSPIYGYSRSRNLLRWTIDQFFERGNNLLVRLNWLPSAKRLFLGLATVYYTQSAVRALRIRYKKSDDIVLIFPSIDGLGLHFLKRCLRKRVPINKVVIRTLQAERRGMFSIPDLVPFVENLVLNSPDMDIRIGFEVARVGEILRKSSKTSSQIFWSPIPSYQEISWRDSKKSDSTMRIGFLGAARKLKGFENVPRIIQSLVSSGKKFEFYLQLAAEEWEGYQDILRNLRELGVEIIFLEGGCSDDLLLQTISKLDCLILPYFVEEYRNAGSGLLFHAADFGVPVISMHGVGFDWDIQQYSLGVLCNSSEEIPNQVILLDCEQYRDSIDNYNLARNEITAALLNFEKKVN